MSQYIAYNNTTLPYNNLEITSLHVSDSPQVIIGNIQTRLGIIIFSTNSEGLDCIWEIENIKNNPTDIKLLYCRDLNFSINNPISGVYNYENDKIQKIYWVDGLNQMRSINIRQSIVNGDAIDLIDAPANSLDGTPGFNISNPYVTEQLSSGSTPDGMIQFCYLLYDLNGSKSVVSPMTDLIDINSEDNLRTVILNIDKIDTSYKFIRIFSIHYSELNLTPEVKIINDDVISKYVNYQFVYSGEVEEIISLPELLLINNTPTVANFIESKDNRLFKFNLKELSYNLDLDMRAFSHNNVGECRLLSGVNYTNTLNFENENIYYNSDNIEDYNYSEQLDAVNPDFNIYKYHKDGRTLGGEGKFLSYSIKTKYQKASKYTKTFKERDIQRIGIIFYNKYGITSDVKWIADFKPEMETQSNLSLNRKLILSVEIKSDNFTNEIQNLLLNGDLNRSDIPVGYKIVRALKTDNDKLIITQGLATPMMTLDTEDTRKGDIIGDNDRLESLTKMPLYLARNFNKNSEENISSPRHNHSLKQQHEIYLKTKSSGNLLGRYFFNTKLLQIHSPDTVFNKDISLESDLKLNIIGYVNNSYHNFKAKGYNDKEITTVGDGELFHDIDKSDGCGSSFGTHSLISPNRGSELEQLRWFQNRDRFTKIEPVSIDINSVPEITERGSYANKYNNDSSKSYNNTLEFLSGGRAAYTSCRYKKIGLTVVDYYDYLEGVMSDGTRCITVNIESPFEDHFTETGLPIVELVRPDSYYYNSNILNGVSVNDRTKTEYIDCSPYHPINEYNIDIESPGDTYLSNFNFARVLRKDEVIHDGKYNIVTDTLNIPVETEINLYNRDDFTKTESYIDITSPSYEEYHSYNNVYSQKNKTNSYFSTSSSFKSTDSISNKIIATPPKVIGETIDSWVTDLDNETLLLDGKYGDINGVVNHNDEIYVLQTSAVSKLIINPRAQIQTEGVGELQIGTGGVLYDYQYITTKSGTLNKWSTLVTNNSFYYVDIINKTIYKVIGNAIQDVSEMAGMHGFFQKKLNYDILKNDNPLLKEGISTGYNTNNQDAYFTFHQGDDTFTISHNNKTNSFTSMYSYTPSIYINFGDIMLTTDYDNNGLWNHFTENYGNFYNQYFPSYIIFQISPDQLNSYTYDSINFNSEAYIDGIDQPNSTITSMESWNEYQNTGKVNLVIGRNGNIRRKFREWKALIPRNNNSRDRLNNPWIFLKLEFNKNNNTKFILHDIIINYHK